MNEKENLLDLIEDAKAVSSKSFSELAFNEVDALAFAQLSYFKFDILGLNSPDDRLSFKKIAQTDFECPSSAKARTKCHYELLKTMSESERYGDFFVTDYFTISSETEEKQFCGVTFVCDSFIYVAFRGTDATIVGWKEDANLSFLNQVPAQAESVKYLEDVANKHKRKPILVGGHSKGGNLAIYACSYAPKSVRKRLKQIYSFDGPGFRDEFFKKSDYGKIEHLIYKLVPYSSIIGLLLENRGNCNICDSKTYSIFQHNPYKWLIKDHKFVPKSHLNPSSVYFDASLKRWLSDISDENRKKFFDFVFLFFEKAEITDFYSRKRNIAKIIKNLPTIISAYKALDEQTKIFVKKTVGELISIVKEEKKKFEDENDEEIDE